MTLQRHLSATPTHARPVGQYVVGLDMLRIAASLLVTGTHYGFTFAATASLAAGAPVQQHYLPLFVSGWVGVEIFFVLSGFVIAYAAERATAAEFFRNRLARLWPAMLICATLSLLLQLLTAAGLSSTDISHWSNSVFFLPGQEYVDPSHWTLPIEVQFYAIIFLLLVLNCTRKIVTVMTLLGAVSAIFCISVMFAEQASGPSAILFAKNIDLVFNQWSSTLRYVCYFTLGMLLNACFTNRITRLRLCIIGLLVVGGLAEIRVRGHEMGRSFGVAHSYFLTTSLWLASILCIVLAVRYRSGITALTGERGAAIMRRLGLMTYPVYLMHQSVGQFFLHSVAPHLGTTFALCLAALATLAIAYGISFWLEPPMARWLRGTTPPARLVLVSH